MRLYIKYMVSLRCKMKVRATLKNIGFQCRQLDLGLVEIDGDLDEVLRSKLSKSLGNLGFALLDEETSTLIENTEILINKTIFQSDELFRLDNTDYFTEILNCDFEKMSIVFAEVNGITVQQYILGQKIERIKELILYDGLALHEIAPKLQYKSVAQLSGYFKKVTGLSLTFYKKLRLKREKIRSKLHTT